MGDPPPPYPHPQPSSATHQIGMDPHSMMTAAISLSFLQVPFTFKYAVDALTLDATGSTAATMPMVTLLPATLLLGYGAARAGAALCNEARNATFAKASTSCLNVPADSAQCLAKISSQSLPRLALPARPPVDWDSCSDRQEHQTVHSEQVERHQDPIHVPSNFWAFCLVPKTQFVEQMLHRVV